MKYNNKLLITSLLLYPCYLLAETSVLEEIVVKEKKVDFTRIDMLKIEQEQANTFFDIFKNSSTTDIGGGASNAQRLYLKGLESSTFDISLDGAKQGKNMFQHRGNELGVNADLLKVVDIKTHTDASNSSALGGSIKMLTKDAQDFVKKDKNYGVILKTSYNTNNSGKNIYSTAYNQFNKNVGAYISLAGSNNNNYKDGNNKEVLATAYKNKDYLFKISALDFNNNDLRFTINQNTNSGDFQWGRLGSDVGVHTNSALLEKIVMKTTNYSLNHTYNPNNIVNLDTNLYLTDINLERKKHNQEYKNQTIGLKVQNHFDFDISSLQNRVSLGFDLQKESGKGAFVPHNLDKNFTKYSDINSNNKAIFMQNRSEIGNFGINYGLRFDSYNLKTGLGEATSSKVSPNFGLDYKLTPNSLVYANYGESSRMNGIIPFTWMLNTQINTSYSSKLEAEKAKKYEIGYLYDKQNTFFDNDLLSFKANVFKTEIKDLIVSKARGGGIGEGGRTLNDIYNSKDKFESKGYELNLAYEYDIFNTSLSYAKINTNTTSGDISASTSIDESVIIRRVGSYDSEKFLFTLALKPLKTMLLEYRLNRVFGIDKPKRDGYTTHDINMMYKFSINSPFTLFASIHNLTNKEYGKHTTIARDGVYRKEMGRDYKFALKYEF